MNRREKLEQAAQLLQEVIDNLDRGTSTCDCCGSTRWNKKHEYQMAIEIEAMAKKCRRIATAPSLKNSI
jgi:hypothetical protein